MVNTAAELRAQTHAVCDFAKKHNIRFKCSIQCFDNTTHNCVLESGYHNYMNFIFTALFQPFVLML